MAGIDPRRSSRARTTQSQSQISSTTSSNSGRIERSTRHFNKGGSPQKSASTGSLSSEPPEDTITADDPFATQRHTRRQGKARDRTATNTDLAEMTNVDDDIQDEDEAVRCICGYDDYPGPPPFDEDTKQGLKDSNDMDPIFVTDVSDDAAGFFVQCDVCKVWQHGACVGIMTEESSPDEYFCEECRKDLHKIFTASNGQRFSHYLPLKRTSRTASRAASINKDGTKSPPKEKETRSARSAASQAASKRRSTMNSREAGYDEAEALRKAIEASKEEAAGDGVPTVPRRPKRGRSDSEERKLESAKRQKTSSRSSSPSFDQGGDESDDAGATTRNGATKSRARNSAPSRNQAEKPSEKDERERQRVEAANKRKGRAERRRADGTGSTILVKVSDTHADTDSDPSEEMPLAARMAANKKAAAAAVAAAATSAAAAASTTTTMTITTMAIATTNTVTTATETPHQLSITDSAPISNQPSPDTPPASALPTKMDKKRSHKKKGRNQHTRDRDGHDEDSPARSQSRDIQKEEPAPPKAVAEPSSKPHAKSKGGMNSKVTMTEMKRRAAALLDFISRTQVELAGETLEEARTAAADFLKANNHNGVEGGGSSTSTASDKNLQDGGASDGPSPTAESAANAELPREFKELNCLEMMDSLTRRLVKWQQEYAA